MDAAMAGLIGAGMGSFITFFGQWLQQKSRSRHDQMRMAVELGMRDQETAKELARIGSKTTMIPPLAAYVIYHVRVLDHIKQRAVSRRDIEKISNEFEDILSGFKR